MSVQVLADTHAVIWYLFDEERLSAVGRAALDDTLSGGLPILVSAISLVEIVYLEEKGRIGAGATERVRQVCESQFPSIEVVPVDARVAYSLHRVPRGEVPDMPDRIIAATAISRGVSLVTRDGKIRASGVRTIQA